ncbi:methyl-accepting chemotaxis protein [Granulicella tundricola]|uniref:Methyl-accepting chemotaxis sensory transducer n=1 Tax=Granulicella tundricola (strain ATCC BAA-1859 / DSM 23138 / MP5ACTX9) TaxID=1198114 RepID=E8WWX9_GRATM|nr:methyl-accepting chemotaxis protein [Granulicella tundricola]ADW68540.1 methyl-accepting chemotaxis sensory transducer [Granulicella tundricola MP5ACTX9]
MRLETKIAISSGALIFTMLLSAFAASLRLREADQVTVRFGARGGVILQVMSLRSHVGRTVFALESEMLNAEGAASRRAEVEQYQKLRRTHWESVDRSLGRLRGEGGTVDLGGVGEGLGAAVARLPELRRLEEQAETLNDRQTPEARAEAMELLEKQILPLEEDSFRVMTGVAETELESAGREIALLHKVHQVAVWTLWGATILGALLGATLAFVLGKNLTRSIGDLVERANSIAGGDLTGLELEMLTNDQVGTMAEAMNRMQRSLSGIIGTVADTAGSLTGSAASMGSASDQIHRRIDQQSQQTQQAATAMQEMSASIAEVSRHTQSAAETARAAAQTARDGGAIVRQMLESMGSIAGAVSETGVTIGLLGEDSKKISQIVTVIDEIARNTNLLALNAAIEAARAGEQGRGFAVVAGEVRRLAESTAKATGEIAGMIHEVQERTRTAVASMEAGTGTVREGVVTTTQAGEALERIIGMAEQVDRMITQIAIAASQQAAAADQSSASLDFIHTLSHDNLMEMATTAAGIENLRGTAVMLEKQVDRFLVAV